MSFNLAAYVKKIKNKSSIKYGNGNQFPATRSLELTAENLKRLQTTLSTAHVGNRPSGYYAFLKKIHDYCLLYNKQIVRRTKHAHANGYKKQQLTWKRLCFTVAQKLESRFIRTSLISHRFEIKQYQWSEKYSSLMDAIYIEYFQTKSRQSPHQSRMEHVFQKLKSYYVLKDDFPFKFASNIKQYLILFPFQLQSCDILSDNKKLHELIKNEIIKDQNMEYIIYSFSKNFLLSYYPQFKCLAHMEHVFVKEDMKKEELEVKDNIAVGDCIIWGELKQWIKNGWFHKFYRKNEIQSAFAITQHSIKREYRSMVDKILIEKFGFPFDVHVINCPSKNLKSARIFPSYILDIYPKTILEMCEHPFNVFNGIHHYILYVRQYPANYEQKNAKAFIRDILKNSTNAVCKYSDKELDDIWFFEETDGKTILELFETSNSKSKTLLFYNQFDSNELIPNIFHIFVKNTTKYKVDNPGYGEHTLYWNDILYYSNTRQHSKFIRNERWAKQFNVDKVQYQHKYKNMGEMILALKFGCNVFVNQENEQKIEAIVDDNTPSMVWVPNDYPYNVHTGIKHDLVWFLNCRGIADCKLHSFIEQHLPHGWIIILYRKPVNVRYIPKVGHMHVFSVNLQQYWSGMELRLKTNMHQIGSALISWKNIVSHSEIVEYHIFDGSFARAEKELRAYSDFIQENKRIFGCAKDALLSHVFKCKKEHCIMKNDFRFVLDAFPYALEENLSQFVLFFVNDKLIYNWSDIKKIIEHEIRAYFSMFSIEFVFWVKSHQWINGVIAIHVIANDSWTSRLWKSVFNDSQVWYKGICQNYATQK